MIAKLAALVGRFRREISVLAAIVGAVASADVLTGNEQHYVVSAAGVLAALALLVKNKSLPLGPSDPPVTTPVPIPASEPKAAPPSAPTPSPAVVVPTPLPDLPPLIKPR